MFENGLTINEEASLLVPKVDTNRDIKIFLENLLSKVENLDALPTFRQISKNTFFVEGL